MADLTEERPLFTARAWRAAHPDGPYLVEVDGVTDAPVEWEGEPTDEHVRTWLADVVGQDRDDFDLQLDFDPRDVPDPPLRPD